MTSPNSAPIGPPPALLLTAAEAAKALAISPRKLWEITNCGELPAVRIGRAVRYRPADLVAWIDARLSRGPAGAGGATP